MDYIVKKRNADLRENNCSKNYRMTSFVTSLKVEDGILLCHTATGEMVLLNEDEYQTLQDDELRNEVLEQELASHLFLVDEDLDEFCEIDEERAENNTGDQCTAITSFTILPTTRCNARCFYCYENGLLQKNMTIETANAVVDFIAQKCEGHDVSLSWFGGEPTVAHHIITYICKKLKKKNIVFHSGMISNGLLLCDDLINTALETWNLKHVQITLDGTEMIYNSVKNYKGYHVNPFQSILFNIACLLKKNIRVAIRINLGLHNRLDVDELIKILKQYFGINKLLHIYVHELDHCYSEAEHDRLRSETTEINQKLIEEGLRNLEELPSIRVHSCMADSDSSIVINPDGGLGKCEHFIYEKLCGSIGNPVFDQNMIRQWRKTVDFPQCRKCVFYPSCKLLKWCNGGVDSCTDMVIADKMRKTQYTMRSIYEKWKTEKYNIRNRYLFILKYQIKIEESEKTKTVNFYDKNHEIPTISIQVNTVLKDIVFFLQQRRSFNEISEMLYLEYDISKEIAENDTEKYLMDLLRDGLIEKSDCCETQEL